MSRPISISDETLLDAARALFTEKGPRATTAEIAARAGVSEGILFKRFGNKAALHKAAMSTQMVGALIQQNMRSAGPLRTLEDFERFIRWQTHILRDVVPLVIMAWSSRTPDEMPTDLTGPKPAPLVSIQTFAEMLEAEMEAGHLARRNAEAAARIVMGSIWYFVFLGLVLGRRSTGIDEDTFVAELARMVFGDLDPGKSRGKRRPRR